MVVGLYVIVVYDVSVDVVNRVRKILKEYFTWIQNSVFVGETTPSRLMAVKRRISETINIERDSVLFFVFRDRSLIKKEIIGIEKSPMPEDLEVI